MALFRNTKESILEQGLNAFSQANQALVEQNEKLQKNNEELNSIIEGLRERILADSNLNERE